MNMKQKGFTLIELIIVIAIIALLAAATFVSVDPARRIGEARDAQRWQDITAVADAYMKYVVDNNGSYVVATTDGTTYYIQNTAGSAGSAPADCNGTSSSVTTAVDLHGLVDAGYIGDIPDDPGGTDNGGTDYYFYKDSTGKVIVGACEKYSGASTYPSVTR